MTMFNSAFAQDSAAIEYAENGTGPVLFTAVDPEGKSIVWSLAGADIDNFSIEDGVLRFRSTPNYEAAADNEYRITVVATDSDGQTDVVHVIVTVTNVEEAGTLTLSPLQPRIGSPVTASLSDLDGAVSDVKWQWAKSADPAGEYVDIEGATAASYRPVMADYARFLRATARYTDPAGSDTATSDPLEGGFSAVEMDDRNRAPEFPDQDLEMDGDQTDQEREIAENTVAGEYIGVAVTATDSNGDSLTYSLDGTDGASFSIERNTGRLQTKAPLNREATDGESYTVMVTATDPSGLSATVDVTIKITNVPEPPVIEGMGEVRHAENTHRGTVVAIYKAMDDEDDKTKTAIRWSLTGTDEPDFSITGGVPGGELRFNSSPNFEAAAGNEYNITVVATDSDGQTDEMDVTVTVTNVAEAGTVTLSPLQPRIGSPVTASPTDIDGAVSDVKWQWAKSTANQNADFEDIDDATAASYTPVMADYAMFLRATATYTDPAGSGTATSDPMERGFMKVDDTNRAPEFSDQDLEMDGDQTDQEREIAENTVAGEYIGVAVTATDPNDDSLTYSLDGTDGASFSIERSSGQLQTKASLNREEKDTYMVTVTATDPSGLSATVNVTIKITDVPEPPVITVGGGLAISGMISVDYAENGTDAVATYTASGPDASMATWSLEGDDAGQFSITNGMLMLMTAPDYEMPMDADMDNEYMVTVKATGGTYMATRDVVVTVTDVEEETPVTGGTLLERFDTDVDGVSGEIDKSEVIMAINDYFDEIGGVTKKDVLDVINLYLDS